MEQTEIFRILQSYNVGNLRSFEELSPGFANRSFRLRTDRGVFLFRWILEKGRQDIHHEIELLNSLKTVKYPAAYPISRIDGDYISSLAEGHVVIYDFISGEHPIEDKPPALEIGNAVGWLSTLKPPADFRHRNTINLDVCIALSNDLGDTPNQLPDIFEHFIEQTQYLENRIGLGLPEGLIHADIFPDNTIFQGEKLQAIIDFEEACWDELLFDLAMTINGFCFPMNELSYPILDSLILGYSQKRKLSPEEWLALPIYIQWTAHGMLSWHLQRLSQVPNARQERRVRELMNRVSTLRNHEKDLVEYLKLRSI